MSQVRLRNCGCKWYCTSGERATLRHEAAGVEDHLRTEISSLMATETTPWTCDRCSKFLRHRGTQSAGGAGNRCMSVTPLSQPLRGASTGHAPTRRSCAFVPRKEHEGPRSSVRRLCQSNEIRSAHAHVRQASVRSGVRADANILCHVLGVLQCVARRTERPTPTMPARSSADAQVPRLPQEVSCPKIKGTPSGYRFYPGYSHSFVRDILDEWPENDLILDPWNGSGATTTVAAKLGRRCVGIDLNPAMVVIARAALLTDGDTAKIRRQACGLGQLADRKSSIELDDPLLEWLDSETVARIRSIQAYLVGSPRLNTRDASELDSSQAFWLTVLFQTVRKATIAWHSSNPTWIKSGDGIQHASLKCEEITKIVRDAGSAATAVCTGKKVYSQVLHGDSTDLRDFCPEPTLVLGSPPYCTRIDYAIATRIELSVLGLAATEQASLRRKLMGTTTVPSREPSVVPAAGQAAQRTLEAVRNHPSKASSTYYAKWLAQYLAGYASSLSELSRITAPNGTIGLVLQGSFYKDIPIDLPNITTDMLAGLGWNLFRSYEFQPRRSMAHINPRAIAYRDGGGPCEQALFFRSEK